MTKQWNLSVRVGIYSDLLFCFMMHRLLSIMCYLSLILPDFTARMTLTTTTFRTTPILSDKQGRNRLSVRLSSILSVVYISTGTTYAQHSVFYKELHLIFRCGYEKSPGYKSSTPISVVCKSVVCKSRRYGATGSLWFRYEATVLSRKITSREIY